MTTTTAELGTGGSAASSARAGVGPLTTGASSSRVVIFWLQIAYLAALVAIAYFVNSGTIAVSEMFGPIPRGIVWFGALGGVLISLSGVFEHHKDWDPSYWPWHVSRPLVGATFACVAVIAFQSGVLAIGGSVVTGSSDKFLLYYLVAFVVGYREETFGRLIKRLADVLLEPAEKEEPKQA